MMVFRKKKKQTTSFKGLEFSQWNSSAKSRKADSVEEAEWTCLYVGSFPPSYTLAISG